MVFKALMRGRVSRGSQRVKEMLIHLEVEHHLQALAGSAEVIHVHVREYICFGENDGVAFAPGKKFAEHAKHVVVLGGSARTLRLWWK